MERYVIVIPADEEQKARLVRCDDGDAPKIGTGGAETAVTSRADLDATAQLTVDLIDQAVALLQTQNADTIGDSFVAIVHPHTSYDIRKDPNWIEAHKYAAPEEIFNGEIGKINNVRFVVSSEAKVWKGDGCPAGLAVYSTLVLGAHAYATTELEGGGMDAMSLSGRSIQRHYSGKMPQRMRTRCAWLPILMKSLQLRMRCTASPQITKMRKPSTAEELKSAWAKTRMRQMC